MKAETSVAVASVVRRLRMEPIRRSSKLAVRTRLRTWVFKDRWQSRVTPKFLTVSEKGTDALPISKESGIERAVDILLEEIIMTSVLASLSFSLLSLSVIQSFMSSMQSRIESMRSGRRSGVAEFWSWESLAYEWWRIEWRSMTAERGVVYRTKRIGPKTDPCGMINRRKTHLAPLNTCRE